MRNTTILAVTLSLALAGCGNGKAPSEKLKDATEELVEEASGEVEPPLAEGPAASVLDALYAAYCGSQEVDR